MKLSDLQPVPGCKKKKKRVGRGVGSGHGKTSCRGHKGQKARSGGGVKRGFEGGQMPLYRRIPKRGFSNIFQRRYAIVNVGSFNKLSDSVITPELMMEKGLVKDIMDGIKVLGEGELTRSITVKAHAFSKSAKEKIIQAKGNIEII